MEAKAKEIGVASSGEREGEARKGMLVGRWYRLSGGNCKTMRRQGRGNNVRDNRPDNVPENGRLDKRVE